MTLPLVCVYVEASLDDKDLSHSKAYANLIFIWLPLCSRACFQIRPHSEGLRVRSLVYLLLEVKIWLITHAVKKKMCHFQQSSIQSRKEWHLVICDNVDEPRQPYVRCVCMCLFACMCSMSVQLPEEAREGVTDGYELPRELEYSRRAAIALNYWAILSALILLSFEDQY